MQLSDITQPIENMTDEELKKRLFELRHRRDIERPAAKARKQKEERKESRKASTAAEKLLSNLSPEELATLLEALGQ